MQNRLPIIVSLVVGLVAVALVNLYVGSVQDSMRPSVSRVLLASHDIKAGTVLDAKDVALGLKSTDSLPKLYVKWDERNLYLGQRVEVAVAEGDYVLASYFGAQGQAVQRLSEKIDAKLNQRALTIPVSTETSLERSIRPGDRVDLLITYSKTELQGTSAPRAGAPATVQKLTTAPLLENVYVLFTGRFGSASASEYSTITVLASPEEAELLIWASNLGKVSILLRNPKDLQPTERFFLSGDASLLSDLGKQPLRIDDVLSKRQTTVEK
jgi:pilus assembly protein CpaB